MAAEEIPLDFGLNLIHPTANTENAHELVVRIGNGLIVSYCSAKWLAVVLHQIVGRFEPQQGQIKLNAVKRQRTRPA